MNIQKKLLEKGFVEGVDYSITNNQLTALPKTRQVEQIIPHVTVIPAVFDAQGVEISPQSESVVNESVFVTETYTEQLPSLESVKLECIDVSLAIGEFLKGKELLRDTENDSINIINNSIREWNFKNIPCPSAAELIACGEIAETKSNQEKINAEALKYLADTDYLIIREMDAGTPCPAEIKALRAAARAKIVAV